MHSKSVEEKYNIKFVAIYLRKSRGETEKDLDNHKGALIEICKSNGWDYEIYEEIVSGESLELRPEAQRLLLIAEEGIYDAILVIDIDRLSRAGTSESDIVKKILIDSSTLLAVKDRIMDLENEQDDITYDIQAFVAKLEYKMIKKRLRQGKYLNAKKGYWSNGTPPLPYTYVKDTKSLKVDDNQLKTYRYIIDAVVIHKKTTNVIARELNNKGMYTAGRKGKRLWTSKTVRDTLLDMTHMQYDGTEYGCIVVGKTKGNAHKRKTSTALKFKKIPKGNWMIFKGNHLALKTKEEHEIIEAWLGRKTKAPRKTTAKRVYPLTGLVKCSYCKHYLGFTERVDRNNLVSIKKCWYVDPFGVKCKNRSTSMIAVVEKLNLLIEEYIKDLQFDKDTIDANSLATIELEIQEKKKIIQLKNAAIDRINDAFENGAYTIEEMKSRKDKAIKEREEANESIRLLQSELNLVNERSSGQRLNILKEFQKIIVNPKLTWEEQNELYKTIIDYIEYTMTDKLLLEVTFK